MPRWRILIVDDEDDIRTIIRGTLAAKYEIVEARDGVDALATLEIAEPDFVILDVMMPLMDGFQTCDAIRRHPRYSTLNVLFLSALNSKEDIKKGYGAGANLYLTKPFDPPRLLKNIDFYFEQTPPPMRRRKFTIEEVYELQKADALKVAQAHAQVGWESHSAPPAPAADPENQQRIAPVKPAAIPVSGTAPTVKLPAAAQPANPPSAPSLPSNPVDGKIRILAADDETDIRIFIRAVLEPKYEVVLAADGLEAVDKITTYQPDVIILDAMMPRMSGYNLIQNLRRNSRFAKIPVLFVSGKATPRDREYALKIGASEFLAKPFTPEEIHEALNSLTSMSGFRVLPKAMSLAQINNAEEERLAAQTKESMVRQDRLHRKEESELEKFLRENT